MTGRRSSDVCEARPRIVRAVVWLLVLMMFSAPLSGCFGEEEIEEFEENVFELLCLDGIANNTWYHYSNATDATKVSDTFNGTSVLVGDNIPACAFGTYYGIGMTTFEPTVGATTADNLYMTSWGNGDNGATAIVR